MTRTFLPAVALALLAAPALAQLPAGPEFRVNTYRTGTQDFPAVDTDSAGNFVVTWTSEQDQSGTGVYAQRFGAEGAPRGSEFRVNTSTTGNQGLGAVAMTPTGEFVIAWIDYVGDPDQAVMAQRFDAAGAPRGVNFRVNTFTTSFQLHPEVAIDDAGNFVVVWTSDGQDGDGLGVFGQRYDSAGSPRGAEFRVNTYTTYDQAIPTLAMKGNGEFVVAWYSAGQDGSGTGVFAQRFAANGSPLGGEFRANTHTPFDQISPSVSYDAAGNFVVAWMSDFQDGSFHGVFGRRFDSTGAPLGSEFQVNTYTTSGQTFPAVNVAPDGSFAVAWASSAQDGFGYGVFAQRYAPSGLPQGAEFRVNTFTPSDQRSVAMGGDSSGKMVVAWSSLGQDGSLEGIYAQRFGGMEPDPVEVDAQGNRVFEPGESVGIAPAWRNVSGVTQTFTGVASNLTGPGAPTNPVYNILDGSADYGVVPNGATGSCTTTGNCYAFAIGIPTARPVLHWDATYREDILPSSLGESLTRTLHLGDSFGDVPRSSPFYRFVEVVLHHNLTGGCGGGNFCPLQSTPREQMAVFVLVAKEGSGYQPPSCVAGSEMFVDVPSSSLFCRWIEELARRGIAGGCGGGNFCPLAPVTREQMSVFALATREGTGYSPAACVAGLERFADVPASSPFCRWIEELSRRGIVGGCGGGNFCPIAQVTREQNAVFVSGTFGLTLY